MRLKHLVAAAQVAQMKSPPPAPKTRPNRKTRRGEKVRLRRAVAGVEKQLDLARAIMKKP
jgi:hypothetical protein